MDKFKNVPIEKETTILFEKRVTFGEYDALYQKWFWDGITAESIIFANEDVAELTDKEIEAKVKTSSLLNEGSSVTLKRSDSGFTFVNFNFVTE